MEQKIMTDKEIMEDIILSQKSVADAYNNFANECVNQQLRTDFLNILRDEHSIQQNVYEQMQKRGWVINSKAEKERIDAVYSKFNNINQNL